MNNNFQNQNWNNSSATANNQQNNQPPPNNQPQTNQPSGIMQIVGAVLPALLEHFTGQKITASGSSPETQLILSQLLSIQQQILTNQQSFNQRLIALESSASQQFTNLVQQVQIIALLEEQNKLLKNLLQKYGH